MQIIPTRGPKQHFQWCLSGIFLLVLWEREQNPGSSLISCTLILCQCRRPIAAIIICRSPSDWSFCQPRIKMHLMTQQTSAHGSRNDLRFDLQAQLPMTSVFLRTEPTGDRVRRHCALHPNFPRLFLQCLNTLHSSSPLQVPPLYYMLQHRCQHCFLWWMSLRSQPIYLASLLCAPVDGITFHFLCCADQKGHLRSRGKKWQPWGKFRYLINSTDKGAARWTEDISAKAQDGIWKSGSIVGLLKYCYCTAMQWSSEDNECTRVHAHTRAHT